MSTSSRPPSAASTCGFEFSYALHAPSLSVVAAVPPPSSPGSSSLESSAAPPSAAEAEGCFFFLHSRQSAAGAPAAAVRDALNELTERCGLVVKGSSAFVAEPKELKAECIISKSNRPKWPKHPSLLPLFKYSISVEEDATMTVHAIHALPRNSNTLHTLLRTSYLSAPLVPQFSASFPLLPSAPSSSSSSFSYCVSPGSVPDIVDLRCRFAFLQLMRLLSEVHSHGFAFTTPSSLRLRKRLASTATNDVDTAAMQESARAHPLHLQNLHVEDDGWIKVRLPIWQGTEGDDTSGGMESSPASSSTTACATASEFLPRPQGYPGYDVPLTTKWRHGTVSNFDYLMAINTACGRTMGDPQAHPVLPWVTNFVFEIEDPHCTDGCWRDLSRSKFRLNKGDTQLDNTYSQSEPRHHITENLSDMTYYLYLARQTPIHTLRKVVRPDFEPKHYPDTLPRLYEITPDECIPEFYTTPSIFSSLHVDLNLANIQLPPWCSSYSQLVSYHRSLLEGDAVSASLHLWIDLNFGHALTGPAAIRQKNVPLHLNLWGAAAERARGFANVGPSSLSKKGFVQLFDEPHPKRLVKPLEVRKKTARNGVHRTSSTGQFGQLSSLQLSTRYLRTLSSMTDLEETDCEFRSAESTTPSFSTSVHHINFLDPAAKPTGPTSPVSAQRREMDDIVGPDDDFDEYRIGALAAGVSPLKVASSLLPSSQQQQQPQQQPQPQQQQPLAAGKAAVTTAVQALARQPVQTPAFRADDKRVSKQGAADSKLARLLGEKVPGASGAGGGPTSSLGSRLVATQVAMPAITLTSDQTLAIKNDMNALAEESEAAAFAHRSSSYLTPDFSLFVSDDDCSIEYLKKVDLAAVGEVVLEMYRSCHVTVPQSVMYALEALRRGQICTADELLPPKSTDIIDSTSLQYKGVPVEEILNSSFRFLFPAHLQKCYEVLYAMQNTEAESADIIGDGSIDLQQASLTLRLNTSTISSLSHPSFAMLLPKLLKPLSAHDSYIELEQIISSSETEEVQNLPPLILALPKFINTLSLKLGKSASSTILLPRVVFLFEALSESASPHAPRLIQSLLLLPFLNKLYHTTNADNFIPSILSMLLNLLKYGCHHNNMESEHDVKKAVVICLVGLSKSENLGPALSARYVIPALVNNIGCVRLHEQNLRHKKLSNTLYTFDISDMHAAQALSSMVPEISEEVIGTIICERLFADQVPSLQPLLLPSSEFNSNGGGSDLAVSAAASALVEVLYALQCCLPDLSAEMIYYHYLENPPLSAHQLLLILLAVVRPRTSNEDDKNSDKEVWGGSYAGGSTRDLTNGGGELESLESLEESEAEREGVYISNPIMFAALVEACSLVSSICRFVRVQHVVEKILPAVDAFFLHIEATYRINLKRYERRLKLLQSEKGSLPTADYELQVQQLVAKVMILPGIALAKELCDTAVATCGISMVTSHCPASKLLFDWFFASKKLSVNDPSSAASGGATPAVGDDKGSKTDDGDDTLKKVVNSSLQNLGKSLTFGWLRRGVRKLGERDEKDKKHEDVKEQGDAAKAAGVRSSAAHRNTVTEGIVGFPKSRPDLYLGDRASEDVMEDPLGLGAAVSELIGMQQQQNHHQQQLQRQSDQSHMQNARQENVVAQGGLNFQPVKSSPGLVGPADAAGRNGPKVGNVATADNNDVAEGDFMSGTAIKFRRSSGKHSDTMNELVVEGYFPKGGSSGGPGIVELRDVAERDKTKDARKEDTKKADQKLTPSKALSPDFRDDDNSTKEKPDRSFVNSDDDDDSDSDNEKFEAKKYSEFHGNSSIVAHSTPLPPSLTAPTAHSFIPPLPGATQAASTTAAGASTFQPAAPKGATIGPALSTSSSSYAGGTLSNAPLYHRVGTGAPLNPAGAAKKTQLHRETSQESRRKDRTWLMGSTLMNKDADPWKRIGAPWSTRMTLLSSLTVGDLQYTNGNVSKIGSSDADIHDDDIGSVGVASPRLGPVSDATSTSTNSRLSGIRAMATNGNETNLVTGSRNGEVLVWDLKCHPPKVVSSFTGHRISRVGDYFRPSALGELYDEGELKTGEILQIELMDQGGTGVLCDGNLNVWDVETGQSLALLKRSSKVYHSAHASGSGGGVFGGDRQGKGGLGGGSSGIGWFGNQDDEEMMGIAGGSSAFGSAWGNVMSDIDPIVAFCSLGLGDGDCVSGMCGMSEERKFGQQLLAISNSRLLHYDLREGKGSDTERSLLTMPAVSLLKNRCEACFGVGTFVPKRLCARHRHPYLLCQSASWMLTPQRRGGLFGFGEHSSAFFGDATTPADISEASGVGVDGGGGGTSGLGSGFTCLTTQSDERNGWVCVGNETGHVHCVERRTGKLLYNWRAHDQSIIQVFSVNNHQILTVSKDRSAVLWDLKGSEQPQKVSSILELPMRGPGIVRNSVVLRSFLGKSGKASEVLYTISGHKASAAAIPAQGTEDVIVKPRNFCDPQGQKVQKKKLCSRALLLLPLRQLMLLGCEDGVIRACV